MDRVGADYDRCLAMMTKKLGANPIAIQIPVGKESKFTGVIDLIEERMLEFNELSLGQEVVIKEIPDEYRELFSAARMALLEKLADFDEGVMEKYLEEKHIPASEVYTALRRATLALEVVPVFCGSAFKNKGIQPLLDGVVRYLPSPLDITSVDGLDKDGEPLSRKTEPTEDFCGLVFKLMSDAFVEHLAFIRVYSGALKSGDKVYNPVKKKKEKIAKLLKLHANKREEVSEIGTGDIGAIVGLKFTTTGDTLCQSGDYIILESMKFPEPVIGIAIEPKSKAEEKKLTDALGKIALEDPSFFVKEDEDTGQRIISGMGELHLEIIVDRLLSEFKVGASVGTPQVAYKETITGQAKGEGKFDQLTGAKGQYGHVVLAVEPNERGNGVDFVCEVDDDLVPKEFLGAIERGVRDSLDAGPLVGYPLTDITVRLVGGSSHDDESTEMAFGIAAAMAIRRTTSEAVPVLLEPMMDLEVITPEDYLGDVMSDLTSKRAKVTGVDPEGGLQIVHAHVPLAEMFGYSTSLRSATQGRANFTMQFLEYDIVPAAKADAIIKKIRGI
jgi:elongation factor G